VEVNLRGIAGRGAPKHESYVWSACRYLVTRDGIEQILGASHPPYAYSLSKFLISRKWRPLPSCFYNLILDFMFSIQILNSHFSRAPLFWMATILLHMVKPLSTIG